jgi:methylmalonyl-CoA/ethylmalonyl-CoA epimerase
MERMGQVESPASHNIFLSDGVVNLSVIDFREDSAAGVAGGKDFVGPHHLGFWVDDLDEAAQTIAQNGGAPMAIGGAGSGAPRPAGNDTEKYRDPMGLELDVSRNGWAGARRGIDAAADPPLARLRHMALAVDDAEAAAAFYENSFGVQRMAQETTPTADAIFLADGVVNLAILNFKKDGPPGAVGKDYIGVHHFGFWVDDLDATQARIEANGGVASDALPVVRGKQNYEMKFLDPSGIMIDVSHTGWVGSQ